LTGINKASVIDAMRSTTSLSTLLLKDDDTSLATLSSNTEAIVEEEDSPTFRQITASPVPSTFASPPPRPKPAPRLWNEPATRQNSLAGLETAIAPNHIIHAIQTSNSPIMGESLSTSPETRSPVSKFSSRSKERSFASRRKGSVPDLELGACKRMKPVREVLMDSRECY
jgi:hypothetical protein